MIESIILSRNNQNTGVKTSPNYLKMKLPRNYSFRIRKNIHLNVSTRKTDVNFFLLHSNARSHLSLVKK